MGTNTLTTISGGIIRTSHPNQYFTALTGTIVPRNAGTGAPEDNVNSCGSTSYRFTRGHFGTGIQLGTSTNNVKIDASGNTIQFKTTDTTRCTVDSNGFNTVYRPSISSVNYVLGSGSGNYQNNSGARVQPTNMSITITTTGRPVLVCVFPDVGAAAGGYIHNNYLGAENRIVRNGTALTVAGAVTELTSLCVLDVPSAGSNNYTFDMYNLVSGNNICVYMRMFAVELA